jgi:hypothetical protein
MPHPRRKHHDPQLHAKEMVAKATLSAAPIPLPERGGLTQVQFSRRADWNPRFVSRLDSLRGRTPDLATIVRYGNACGTVIGLVFVKQGGCALAVVTAVTLQGALESTRFELLEGRPIGGQRLAQAASCGPLPTQIMITRISKLTV